MPQNRIEVFHRNVLRSVRSTAKKYLVPWSHTFQLTSPRLRETQIVNLGEDYHRSALRAPDRDGSSNSQLHLVWPSASNPRIFFVAGRSLKRTRPDLFGIQLTRSQRSYPVSYHAFNQLFPNHGTPQWPTHLFPGRMLLARFPFVRPPPSNIS